MPTPTDGLPTNLSPLVRDLLAELQAREPEARLPLVRLRRRTCGCLLASVYRLPSGDLLLGERRALVQRTLERAQARQQVVARALVDFDVNFAVSELSCQHGRQVKLPVAEVRQAVEAVARGSQKARTVLAL